MTDETIEIQPSNFPLFVTAEQEQSESNALVNALRIDEPVGEPEDE